MDHMSTRQRYLGEPTALSPALPPRGTSPTMLAWALPIAWDSNFSWLFEPKLGGSQLPTVGSPELAVLDPQPPPCTPPAPVNEDEERDADGEALLADADGLQDARVTQLAADHIGLEEPWLLGGQGVKPWWPRGQILTSEGQGDTRTHVAPRTHRAHLLVVGFEAAHKEGVAPMLERHHQGTGDKAGLATRDLGPTVPLPPAVSCVPCSCQPLHLLHQVQERLLEPCSHSGSLVTPRPGAAPPDQAPLPGQHLGMAEEQVGHHLGGTGRVMEQEDGPGGHPRAVCVTRSWGSPMGKGNGVAPSSAGPLEWETNAWGHYKQCVSVSGAPGRAIPWSCC